MLRKHIASSNFSKYVIKKVCALIFVLLQQYNHSNAKPVIFRFPECHLYLSIHAKSVALTVNK